MSTNQLLDEGAVIGYKPTLEYVKKGKSSVNAQNTSKNAHGSGNNKIQYSKTVEGFSSNSPSSVLKNIDFVTDNMKKLIDKLSLSFKNGNWGQYSEISSLLSAVESNNKEYIDNFIDYHKNNIKSSIIPESIGLIYNTEQRMKILSEVLKKLYYGDSTLSTEETEEIDKAYLKNIQYYEANNESEKINYLALSNDSVLNKSINMHTFLINRKAIDIANVISTPDKLSADSSKESVIQKLFNEVNDDLNFREVSFNEQQSIEIMEKTLYNYYNKRQELIELYDLFSDNKDSTLFANKVESYTEQINEAIANVNRALAGNQHFLTEIAKLEREKHLLMNIYATVNYKSEI